MPTITALYDSMADANDAVDRLVQAGIPRGGLTVIDQSRAGAGTASTTAGADEGGGFFSALRDLFVPDEDRHTYAEGIRRGGALLTAKVEDAHADKVVDIIDKTGAVDLDTRESEWRAQGWTGGSAAGAVGTAGLAAGTAKAGAVGEQRIETVEEQLHVGKREVGRGGVRVRSYVVETPVQESVTLREEHVHVERRPVDRPLQPGENPELFRDRTIELAETIEEAVVGKTARVTGEVVVSKDVEQRTETVTDKVRRTEVDVDRVEGETTRTGTAPAGTAGTVPGRDRR